MGDEGEEDGEQDRLLVKLAPPTNSDNQVICAECVHVIPNSQCCVAVLPQSTHFKVHIVSQCGPQFSAPAQHVYDHATWL